MASVTDRSRELVVRTRQHYSHTISVAMQDLGVGTDPDDLDQLFSASYQYQTERHGHEARDFAIHHRSPRWTDLPRPQRRSGLGGIELCSCASICPRVRYSTDLRSGGRL